MLSPDLAIPFVAHSLAVLIEKAGLQQSYCNILAFFLGIGAAFIFVPNPLVDLQSTIIVGVLGGLAGAGFSYIDKPIVQLVKPQG